MPHLNPSQTSTNPPSGSQASDSTSRDWDLAAYARPNQEESLYDLLTVPFNPDPCLYPPPRSMADHQSYNYSSFLPVDSSPFEPSTTSIIPPHCIEELINIDFSKPPNHLKWGGCIHFQPFKLPDNKNRNVRGTPLRDCLAGFGLRDPEQRIFQSLAAAGKTHIDFRIKWPGYPQLDWTVPLSIYGSDTLLVTKREFAYRIAIQYQNFVLMCENNRSLCQNQRWRVGPEGYTLDRIRLSMLQWMENDTWQAHMTVLTDREPRPKRKTRGRK